MLPLSLLTLPMPLRKYQRFGFGLTLSAAIWYSLYVEAFDFKLSPPLREVLVAVSQYLVVWTDPQHHHHHFTPSLHCEDPTRSHLSIQWVYCMYGCLACVPPKQFPLYSLIVLGCHALASIGMGLIRFNNCPEAATELEKVRYPTSLLNPPLH